jgi:dihydrofolate reductase
MLITLVAAMSRNGIIGKDNKLPWHFSEDLKHFKKITSGKPIIMGRKTFESMGSKALPLRRNIILTHDLHFQAENCVIVHSLDDALKAARPADEVMIIGGAKIYEQFLPFADRCYLTVIDQEYQGDTYFPTTQWIGWKMISEECRAGFTIKLLERQ